MVYIKEDICTNPYTYLCVNKKTGEKAWQGGKDGERKGREMGEGKEGKEEKEEKEGRVAKDPTCDGMI